MIYLGFLPFLYLLIIGIVVSLILFFVPKIKVKLPGGYPVGLIVGYLGAWVGTPVFGRWEFLTFDQISIISAILGAIAAILLANSCAECCRKYGEKQTETQG